MTGSHELLAPPSEGLDGTDGPGMRRPYVLVLGTADWDQPIATNQHYVVRELCREGCSRVRFVESLALRRPELTARDLSRVATRIRSAIRGTRRRSPGRRRQCPDGLDVKSPLVLPVHSGIPARLNRHLLSPSVADWIAFDGLRLLWTYSPVTYGLERRADATVYHCVDLMAEVPGIARAAVERGERQLALQGARAAASSGVVKRHLESLGFAGVMLWENVADFEAISRALPLGTHRAANRVIFAGNLSPGKVDYRILESLADAGFDVCVAGPRAEGGGSDTREFASLMGHGVRYLGVLPLEQLAEEMASATVGVIPYLLNDYTRGVSPLKTYEYLAAGLAVVSTPIPGVDASLAHVDVEESVADFVGRVARLARVPTQAEIESRISVAKQHSWSGRGDQVRSLVREVLPG